MNDPNSQITRLKITYLAKLLFFIILKSLCRYSSKAVSLLMRRTQEMGNRRTTHNVVHIKASDLLSFPLHSFSQGWCVGEEEGELTSSVLLLNMWWRKMGNCISLDANFTCCIVTAEVTSNVLYFQCILNNLLPFLPDIISGFMSIVSIRPVPKTCQWLKHL